MKEIPERAAAFFAVHPAGARYVLVRVSKRHAAATPEDPAREEIVYAHKDEVVLRLLGSSLAMIERLQAEGLAQYAPVDLVVHEAKQNERPPKTYRDHISQVWAGSTVFRIALEDLLRDVKALEARSEGNLRLPEDDRLSQDAQQGRPERFPLAGECHAVAPALRAHELAESIAADFHHLWTFTGVLSLRSVMTLDVLLKTAGYADLGSARRWVPRAGINRAPREAMNAIAS